MANAVIMPKAGISVECCIMGEWQKKPGDLVAIGDILFTYETDKASFECESTAEGELLECFYETGDEVPCLVNVCAVGAKGEDVSALRPEGGSPAESQPSAAPADSTVTSTTTAVSAPAAAAGTGGGAASPRARSLAERSGVDASLALGTGPNGRVIERDVRALIADGVPAVSETLAAAPATAASTAAAETGAEYEDVKFSGIRRAISKSMHGSLSTMAQLTHHHSFDASTILNYRKTLKALGGDYAGITIGDMILYAVSRTLKSCPYLNANMLDDNNIRLFKGVNLGVAVDTERGLMVPTVMNADRKSLLEISTEVKSLAALCRTGSISPDLLRNGSFTVSNLGAVGVEMFTPVINPPQTGILGVCATTERPRKNSKGEIELYPAMGLSLTYDHRAVDGAPASRFASELCRNLEAFTALLAI